MKRKAISKMAIIWIFMLVGLLEVNSLKAATYYSIATGNWNATGTWSLTSGGAAGTGTPSAADDVVIEDGDSVIVNVGASCLSLTIKNLSKLAVATNITIACSGNINVESGGILYEGQNSTISLQGNYTQIGSFSFNTSSTSGGLLFNGSSLQTIYLGSVNRTVVYARININNSTGVKVDKINNVTYTLNLNGASATNVLTLTSGDFDLNQNNLLFTNSSINSTVSRTSGNIINVNRISVFKTTGSISFPAGTFKNIKINSLDFTNTGGNANFQSNASTFPAGETIYVGSISGPGYLQCDHIQVTGNVVPTTNNQKPVRFNTLTGQYLNTNLLQIGDGSNLTCNFDGGFDSKFLDINVGTGTVTLDQTRTSGAFTVSNPLKLTSGTLTSSSNAASFTIDNNAAINRVSGAITINTGTYTYGTGIQLSYTGNANQTIGDEIKTGSNIGALTLNLSDNTKTITTKSGSSLTVTGNVALSSGTLALANVINIGGNYTRAASGATLTQGSHLVTLNGTSAQTLTRTGGGNLTFSNLTINSSGGVSLASSTNATNLAVTGDSP